MVFINISINNYQKEDAQMDILGKIRLFPKMRGKFMYYETSISKKLCDINGKKTNKYVNVSLEVKFGNADLFNEEFFKQFSTDKYYELDIKSGFLSVDTWTDKITHSPRNKLVIVVSDGQITGSGEVNKADGE